MHTGLNHDHHRLGATRVRRLALALAVVSALLIDVADRARADCCICAGTSSNFCLGATVPCSECPGYCAGQQGTNPTMLACCENDEDVGGCRSGVADSCGALDDGVCLQTAAGVGGFCDGTCLLGTPTPTSTPTATPTVTPTSTPTPTTQPNGSDCTTPGQCASTFCVDGVCCDSACTDPLMQCNLPGQAGTCTSTAAEAPTLTPRALLLALVVLGGLAAWALRRRTRGGQSV